MSDFLDAMAASSRQRVSDLLVGIGRHEIEARAAAAPPPLPLYLSGEGFDLMAEVKLASPSEGRLAPRGDDARRVESLARALGSSEAAALSVLTEPSVFGGDLEHLEIAARTAGIPVMRKDFLVDPIQVLEARSRGASGVLLISRLLGSRLLAEMTDLTLSLGMFALVEVFDEADIATSEIVFDREILVGVNSRDLATLEVDRDRHRRLARSLPDLPLVAESGLVEEADIELVASLGYDLALVGTALSRAGDARGLVTALTDAGRRVAVGGGSS